MNQVLREETLPGQRILQIVEGDLTEEPVDAIVNAANAHLKHGSGVAGAIVRRGGEDIQRESDAWVAQHGPVSHARPAYTSAGELPCRYIVHAVGPVWGDGDEDRKLEDAVKGSLQVASELGLHSIAFPAISTGIFGFPKERAAAIFFSVFTRFFEENRDSSLETVRLTLFNDGTLQAFLDTLEQRE